MTEGAPIPTPSALSSREAVDEMVRMQDDLLNAPRSVAMKIPEDLRELANALRRLPEIPVVEITVSFDRSRNILVLTSGDAYRNPHRFLVEGFKGKEPRGDRVESNRIFTEGGHRGHTHQTVSGVEKPHPSFSDWLYAAGIYKHWNAPHAEFIFSKAGITRYLYEKEPPSWQEMDRINTELYKERGLAGVKIDDVKDQPEVLQSMEDTKQELARRLGASLQIIRWEETDKIVEALREFLSVRTPDPAPHQ